MQSSFCALSVESHTTLPTISRRDSDERFPLAIARERRVTVRALLLGDRIETAGLERNDVLSTIPLAFRAGEHGVVALFRYGVVVTVGMSPLEEEEVIGRLDGRIVGTIKRREENLFKSKSHRTKTISSRPWASLQSRR